MRLFHGATTQLPDGTRADIADVIGDPVSRGSTYVMVALPGHLQGMQLIPIDVLGGREGHAALSWATTRVQSDPEVAEVVVFDLAPQQEASGGTPPASRGTPPRAHG